MWDEEDVVVEDAIRKVIGKKGRFDWKWENLDVEYVENLNEYVIWD